MEAGKGTHLSQPYLHTPGFQLSHKHMLKATATVPLVVPLVEAKPHLVQLLLEP
jgi:hypothetical protein